MTTEQFIQMLEDELETIKELAAIHDRLCGLTDKMETTLKKSD